MAPPWTIPLLPFPPWLGAASNPDPPGSAGNPLSQADAAQLFGDLAAQPQIPFDYPRDGCYARAHEMCRIMQERGIDCGKAWIYASPGNSLRVEGTSMGTVEWRYHVAPVVNVKGADGVTRPMVVDPSMFDKPVTVDEWKGKQHDPGAVVESTDGGPFYRDQGSDPKDALRDDDHKRTQETLEHFRDERDAWKAAHSH
jgi:hypothetical protein